MTERRDVVAGERRLEGGGVSPLEETSLRAEVRARSRVRSRCVALFAALCGVGFGALAFERWNAGASPTNPRAISAPPAPENERGAEEILAELEGQSFEGPPFDASTTNPEFQREQHRRTAERILELTDELRRAAPEHDALSLWMDRRWSVMTHTLARPEQSFDEAHALSARSGGLRVPASLARLEAATWMRGFEWSELEHFARDAERAGGDSVRLALAWWRLATFHATSVESQREAAERIEALAGHSRHLTHPLERLRARIEQVGTSLALSFDDVRAGTRVDLAHFRGRPVLLLVWSGHRGEVLDALASARRLRAELGPRGLVVLGAHEWRIEGGAEVLRERLSELDFEVPHLYEEPATPWEGQVRALGVREVPCALLFDASGRVAMSSQSVAALEPLARELTDAARKP